MANPRPRVLITRSAHQSSELAGHLRSLGAEPILIPALELTEPSSFAALDAALAHIDTFHWLVFTSANAVEAFHHRFPSPQPLTTNLRIAAIGPANARALQAIGLAADLIPPQAVAESLTEALLPHVRQPGGSPTRFLLVRAESVGDTPPREHLPETLRAAGAEVTIAPAYRTLIPQDSIPAIRALFQSQPPPVDAITFTSSSTVRNLLALCEAAGVALPPTPLRISIGPITSQTLRDAGLPPDAEAPEATIASLAQTAVSTPRTRSSS